MVVVSTVGLLQKLDWDGYDKVDAWNYYETMVFHADKNDTRYFDIDVTRQIDIESPARIAEIDMDDKANEMHDVIVEEIKAKLLS